MDSSTRHRLGTSIDHLTVCHMSDRRRKRTSRTVAESWTREGPVADCPQDVSAPALGLHIA